MEVFIRLPIALDGTMTAHGVRAGTEDLRIIYTSLKLRFPDNNKGDFSLTQWFSACGL